MRSLNRTSTVTDGLLRPFGNRSIQFPERCATGGSSVLVQDVGQKVPDDND